MITKKSSAVSASTEKNDDRIFNPSQPSNEHHISFSWDHHKRNSGNQFRLYIGNPCHIFVKDELTFIPAYLHIPVNKNCFKTVNGNFSINSH
jgi:hypothetical protein